MVSKVFPVIFLLSSLAAADDALVIDHTPAGCLLTGKYPELDARTLPAKSTTTARVYFRADNVPYWSSVAMKIEGDGLRAVLSKPLSTSREVYYYIEAKDPVLGTKRTTEYLSSVVAKPDLCPGGGRVAKSLDSASPVVERGTPVALTEAKGSGGHGKWIALGALGAAGAGTGIVLASRSAAATSIPDGTYMGTLDGYIQNAQSTCAWQLSVDPGSITIIIAGHVASVTFVFPGAWSYSGLGEVSACPPPAVPPPPGGAFSGLAVVGASIQGMTVAGAKSFALMATFANGRVQGDLSVSGGPPGYTWSAGLATFDLPRSP